MPGMHLWVYLFLQDLLLAYCFANVLRMVVSFLSVKAEAGAADGSMPGRDAALPENAPLPAPIGLSQ